MILFHIMIITQNKNIFIRFDKTRINLTNFFFSDSIYCTRGEFILKREMLKSLSYLLKNNKQLLEKFEFNFQTDNLELLSKLDETQIDNILSVDDERMQLMQLYLYLTRVGLETETTDDIIYSLYESDEKHNSR